MSLWTIGYNVAESEGRSQAGSGGIRVHLCLSVVEPAGGSLRLRVAGEGSLSARAA